MDHVATRRLRAAGARLRAADAERASALAELKQTLVDVDGSISDEEATALTGVASEAVRIIKHSRRGRSDA